MSQNSSLRLNSSRSVQALLLLLLLCPAALPARAEFASRDGDTLAFLGDSISSMSADGWEPGGPWDAQSDTVKELVDARDTLSMSAQFRSRFLAQHPQAGRLDQATRDLDDRLVALQRATAKPYPYHFEIRAKAGEPSPSPDPAPIPLNPGPHLFLDDSLIETSSNLIRRVNQPVRHPAIPNPIVTGKEDGCFQPYLTVLRDPETGRFRLWYGVHTADFNPTRSRLGYMESADGISWIRPHRVLDDPAPIQFGVSVLDEGSRCPAPSQRFKYGWYDKDGLRVAASPDGLHWKVLSPEVVLKHNHDINSLFWDPRREHYLATISSYRAGPTWSGKRRVTLQSSSTNLLQWRKPWFVLTPDDRQDEGETQFYAMDGYLRRGDLLIGMVKVLRDDLKADSPPDPPNAYGIGYTTLAWSHDGEHWTRDREPFFDRSPQRGAWDHAHAWIDEQVPVGEEIYLYYAGYRHGHKVNRFEERQIGLVKMKRDRYVARQAGPSGGSLTTPPVILNAMGLTLNADARDGSVKVQILTPDGQAVPGFARADCEPVRGDSLEAPVRWRQPLAVLRDRPVRLQFFLTKARLFAFGLQPF